MALAIARLRLIGVAAILRRPRPSRVRGIVTWLVAIVLVVAIGVLAAQLGAAVIVLGTATLTIVAAGVGLVGDRDGALDPRAFRGLASPPIVALGTTLGALVSPLTVLAIGLGVVASTNGVEAGWVGGLVLAGTMALARLVADLGVVRDRTQRGVVVLVLLVLAALAPFALGSGDALEALRDSPFAASIGWAMGGAALWAWLTPLALAVVWLATVWWRMEHPDRATSTRRLGMFAAAAGVPWMAVAARVVTLWIRDRRYHVVGVAIVVLPVLIALPLWLAGLPKVTWTLLPVALLATFMGWAMHNDLAYDGTASWAQLAARVPGWQDRLGRMVPALVLGVPVALVATRIGVTLWGDERMLWPAIGAVLALLGAGLGVSAIFGAAWPYPVAGADDGPFVAPASQTVTATITQASVFVVAVGIAAPVVVPLVLERQDPDAMWGWLGLGLGAVVAMLGVWIGGAILDRRAPELLAAAMRD